MLMSTPGTPKIQMPGMGKVGSLNLVLLAQMFKEADDFSSVGGNMSTSQPPQTASQNPSANNNPAAFGATSGNSASAGYSNTMQAPAMGNSMAVPVMRWIGERIKLSEILKR